MYDIDKLSHYPAAIEDLRQGKSHLLTVHLMPQNFCNQSCSFCSYRLPENKNSTAFDDGAYLPLADLTNLIVDLKDLGVKGIEVTGGGEPLAYPHQEIMWKLLARSGIATALVTNGTLLARKNSPLAAILRTNLKWVRVSIDAAYSSTYARMRRTPERSFARAWEAVKLFAENRPNDPEFRLGVGFTLANENIEETYDFVAKAKDSGADNVRLSLAYSDQHLNYFESRRAVHEALDDADRAARDFQDKDFTVINLMRSRYNEIAEPYQNYPKCHTQQLLCVVEGTGKVYTCCTFTGSEKGIQGNFITHPGGFKALWASQEKWRAELNPRLYCHNSCLYRDRNLMMIQLVKDYKQPIHKEFI